MPWPLERVCRGLRRRCASSRFQSTISWLKRRQRRQRRQRTMTEMTTFEISLRIFESALWLSLYYIHHNDDVLAECQKIKRVAVCNLGKTFELSKFWLKI